MPEDDPTGIRLSELTEAELRHLIHRFAAVQLTPLEIAAQLRNVRTAPDIHPDVAALARYVIPHLPIVISVFNQLVQDELRMELAPGRKLVFYQRAQTADPLSSIRGTDSIWSPLMPAGVRIKHDTYTVAGVIIGEREPMRRALLELHPPYFELMGHVARACGDHSQACLTAVRMAYTPVTKFGHHLSSHTPEDTEEIAEQMRHTLLVNAELMLHVPAGSLANSPMEISADHRLFEATADGGCGYTDPHIHRFSAYVASFVNCLPLALTNPHLRQRLIQSRRWPKGKSRTLRFMHVLLTEFSKMASDVRNVEGGITEGLGISHSPKFISILTEAVKGDGTIDVTLLATAAHCHGHRSLARVFGQSLARARERITPLLPRITIVRDASAAPGAQALLNQYGITDETKLTPRQVAFLFCHRLGIPLPYLKPPYRCSPKCKTHIDGVLKATMPHGFHQIQCNMHFLSTMRHDAWLETISKHLRKWCGITTIMEQNLRHSETNMCTIDAIFSDPTRPEQWPICCDLTCVNPMLPTYARDTYEMTVLAKEKVKHGRHERGCRSLNRHFMAAVVTPAGSMGRKVFLDWWQAVWKQASYQHVRYDRTAHDIHVAKQHAEASLHAVLVRHSTHATEFLTTPASHSYQSSASTQDAGVTSEQATPRRAASSARGRGRGSRHTFRRGRGRAR